MRGAVKAIVALLVLAALAAGGILLWNRRPWRVVASVNGATLTARELDMRVATYLGYASVQQPGQKSLHRDLVAAWIAKELLLGEAVQRNVLTGQGDEKEAMDLITSWLKTQGKTPEQFFNEGPLPEDAKRQDFKEGILINNLLKSDLAKRGFSEIMKDLRAKSLVKCPEFPELEKENVSLPRSPYLGLWGWAPMRVIVSVDGNMVTSAELDLRALTMLEDVRRMGRTVPEEREQAALQGFRRDAIKQWILKQVLCAEAARRGFSVTPADEKVEQAKLAKSESGFNRHNITVSQFFEEGPLPESVKRADFRAGILIKKFTLRDIGEKITVTSQDIEAKMAKDGLDRKTAIDNLRNERFLQGYRNLFRSLFVKARVSCPECRDFERVDGVSPPRQSDWQVQ